MAVVKLDMQALAAGEWMMHNSVFARATKWLLQDGRQDGAVHLCSYVDMSQQC